MNKFSFGAVKKAFYRVVYSRKPIKYARKKVYVSGLATALLTIRILARSLTLSPSETITDSALNAFLLLTTAEDGCSTICIPRIGRF